MATATAVGGPDRVETAASSAAAVLAVAVASQRLLGLLALAVQTVNVGAEIYNKDQRAIYKLLSGRIKSENVPENKDGSDDDDDDDDDEDNDDEGGDDDDDAEEEFSGEEDGGDDDDEDDDPEANGEGGGVLWPLPLAAGSPLLSLPPSRLLTPLNPTRARGGRRRALTHPSKPRRKRARESIRRRHGYPGARDLHGGQVDPGHGAGHGPPRIHHPGRPPRRGTGFKASYNHEYF